MSNDVLFCLILLNIALTAFGFYKILEFLSNLQKQATATHKLQKIFYNDVFEKLKLMRFVTILKLKDYCIKHELYEDAQRFDEILDKDFSDLFKK